MKKECYHEWRSVYYGCEWEVECKHCEKSVWDTYDNETACMIADNLTKR